MTNTVWHSTTDKQYLSSHEIIVKVYNHPFHGTIYGTLLDFHLVSIVGTNGPIDFQLYPDGEYFSIGDFVTKINEDNFITRGF
jgi:hypothetical protein